MNLIDESLILIDQQYSTKDEVITSLAEILNQQGRLYDLKGYIAAVKQREEEVSTNMGDAIAIPHGRCDAVKEPSLLFTRLLKPIIWDDEAPVQYIFQIAVPQSAGDLHLKILAKLARKLIYEEFKQQLFQAKDKNEILTLLNEATGGLLK